MFVVERLYAMAELREQSEIDGGVDHLEAGGYRPALRSMVEAASKVATLTGRGPGVEALINRERRFRLAPQRIDIDAPIGDLLFKVVAEIAERCYLVWTLELESDCGREQVDAAFEWAAVDCELVIKRVEAGA